MQLLLMMDDDELMRVGGGTNLHGLGGISCLISVLPRRR